MEHTGFGSVADAFAAAEVDGAALLDAFCENPWDRVGSSRWKSVDVMRQWLGDHPRKVNGRPRRKSRPTLTVADTNGGPTLPLLPRRKAAFT